MATSRVSPVWGAAFFALTALLAACGGGGGGGGTSGGGGGGGVVPPGPTTNPTSTPTVAPTATAAINGTLTVGGTGVSTVLFTCGCSSQAGVVSASNGSFAITASAQATPAAPTPTYTAVPGRNYMLIGTTASHAQTWSMEFLGNSPTTNLNLMGAHAGPSAGDVVETAAALYIYYASSQIFSGSSDQSFDQWNFNTIATWTQRLQTTSNRTPAEAKLINDIAPQQAANAGLYPSVPAWDHSQIPNTTMATDLSALFHEHTDTSIPTPCPSTGCTGGPTP